MKKIGKIKIGGHNVRVKFYPTSEISGLCGEAWSNYNIIRICSDYPVSQQEATLLHEILHHILDNAGFEYKKDDDNAVHSERVVAALAQGLYQVLKDNHLQFDGRRQ